MEKERTLEAKLSLIQKEFKANKSRFNSFGKYNFRSAEDILEGLKPFNEKYGVAFAITEELISTNPPIIMSSATVMDVNGINAIHATAIVGVDLNQKGMQVPQQYGSASSYAKKYALGNLLLIDDTQDADASNTHGKETKVKPKLEGEALVKAKEYIANGGSLDAIKSKYEIDAATLNTL